MWDEPISLAPRSRSGSDTHEGRDRVHLTGRTRQSKLVHLEGPAAWLGSLLDVRVEHAGPYALRGVAASIGASSTMRESSPEPGSIDSST